MKRIQRKRIKGWKMPEGAIYIGRGSKWGNPFLASEYGLEGAINNYRQCILNNTMAYAYFDVDYAIIQFDRFKWMSEHIEDLRGYDLACWCKESEPCHGDFLIELINKSNENI